MTTSSSEARHAYLKHAELSDDSLTVELSDGRTLSVPLAWYPRLVHGTRKERAQWRLVGGGEGLHWPLLDEDISIENLILGQPSGESQASLKRWLDQRAAAWGPGTVKKAPPKKRGGKADKSG